MTATFLIEAAHVELLILLLGHPKAFSVWTVLRHKPLLWRSATKGAGGEAPVVLHDDLSVDSLHEIVDEDGSPQVDFRIVNKFQLFQRHVKNMGPLLKYRDCFMCTAAEWRMKILFFHIFPFKVCDLGCCYRIRNSPVMRSCGGGPGGRRGRSRGRGRDRRGGGAGAAAAGRLPEGAVGGEVGGSLGGDGAAQPLHGQHQGHRGHRHRHGSAHCLAISSRRRWHGALGTGGCESACLGACVCGACVRESAPSSPGSRSFLLSSLPNDTDSGDLGSCFH